MMTNLSYQNGELTWGDITLRTAAEQFGTPVYVYDRNTIESDFLHLKKSFGSLVNMFCYAIKANANPEIIKIIKELGAGADIVSLGELYAALEAGVDPQKIVFAGAGKTDEEIKIGMESNLLAIIVESETELQVIEGLAKELDKKQPVLLRVNPNVDAESHPYISTGMGTHKFGIDIEHIEKLAQYCHDSSTLEFQGLHVHIGSQLEKKRPIYENFKIIAGLVERIEKMGIKIPILDLGGGVAVNYHKDYNFLSNNASENTREDCDTLIDDWVSAVKNNFDGSNQHIIFEPGRSVVARGGILITKVLYRKKTSDKEFVIVDAGSNDFIRPKLYGAFHGIVSLNEPAGKMVNSEVVGPLCETGDILARDIMISDCKRGDYLAILSTGAYGYSESSNSNLRPKPPEVLIENGKLRCIRPKQKYSELY